MVLGVAPCHTKCRKQYFYTLLRKKVTSSKNVSEWCVFYQWFWSRRGGGNLYHILHNKCFKIPLHTSLLTSLLEIHVLCFSPHCFQLSCPCLLLSKTPQSQMLLPFSCREIQMFPVSTSKITSTPFKVITNRGSVAN